jgi:hypothetical protein
MPTDTGQPRVSTSGQTDGIARTYDDGIQQTHALHVLPTCTVPTLKLTGRFTACGYGIIWHNKESIRGYVPGMLDACQFFRRWFRMLSALATSRSGCVSVAYTQQFSAAYRQDAE